MSTDPLSPDEKFYCLFVFGLSLIFMASVLLAALAYNLFWGLPWFYPL